MSDLIPKKIGKYSENGQAIPHPAETCSVTGCDNETSVIVLLMRDQYGKQKAAEQPSWYVRRSGDEWYLKPGWEFDTWVTRCSKCYERDYKAYKNN